jgi:hypothetical protein
LSKCPHCGAEYKFDAKTQLIHCDYCGSNFKPEKVSEKLKGAKKEDLVIKETYISEGRTLKRRKAASHSRVAKHYHRTSHIYVCVTDNMEKKED